MVDHILVDELCTGYGPIQVIWDASFAWNKSTPVLRITGANGAGKSTLVKAIAGTLPAWSGRVMIDGTDATKLSSQERYRLGFTLVPEGRELFAGMTVEENLKIGALNAKSWPAAKERILHVFPELTELLKRRVEQLSGGQQQMVAVGRGMAGDPVTIVLDEPYAGLAPRVIQRIEESIARLIEAGTGVLIIEEERTMKSQGDMLYMDRGRLFAEKPSNRRGAL